MRLVSDDVGLNASEGERLGLHLNVGKCKILSPRVHSLPNGLGDFSAIQSSSWTLLGAPLFQDQGLDDALDRCYEMLRLALVILDDILRAHDALRFSSLFSQRTECYVLASVCSMC